MNNETTVAGVRAGASSDPSQTLCPWCSTLVTLIWVHGHGQCPSCGINIDECCRGEQICQPVGETAHT